MKEWTAHLSWIGKDVKTKVDLFRKKDGRDNGSQVLTFPRNCVVEKSKWMNRKHKAQTLQSGMVEITTLEVWSYNKTDIITLL